MSVRIGCQGWNYDDWTTKATGETVFYPRGTKSAEMLSLYAGFYDTVEVDSTFYAVPSSASIENWFRKTPDDFTFALKLPQQITHDHALRPASFDLLDEFCDRVRDLKQKLGIVLVQLAPQFEASKENARNLRVFLGRLPRDIRFAVEFRGAAWMVDWTYGELVKNNVALAYVEGGWIPRETMFGAIAKTPAEFAYVRFMGERDLTTFDRVRRHEDAVLARWNEAIGELGERDAFAYFSNFFEGHAPASAANLSGLRGIKVRSPEELENQGALF